MLKMGFWEANCLYEILLPHFWSITCILGIVRTLKGFNRWKTIVGSIRWRKLWSQEVGTEKMWELIWSWGLNPVLPTNTKAPLWNSSFPPQVSNTFLWFCLLMHARVPAYVYMQIKPEWLSLGDSLLCLLREQFICVTSTSHVIWSAAGTCSFLFNKEKGTEDVEIRMKRQLHALPHGQLLIFFCKFGSNQKTLPPQHPLFSTCPWATDGG